ncbi:His Kinase A (phospho-acceptor) domain-containing protein [Tenacibaculum sp. MAR_2009_124]|uniref:sensor histidine kinase n=1 Tax=Tenacibaculum sp. MAR_2009_124 TaxID=1250059 RepID=UPI00089A6395|nr:HAMP domain-containing sensor histidine kinase [Tenacibaculum sp. MAR_2009_124]SEC30477.1 His Kinase A (phospho-acceptor) domain-containing protein [Tenacibaculum sp. MAR_2009_124]
MKTRINILIIVSIIALVTLSVIQYSLIENTFKLQRDVFFKEMKQELKFLEKTDQWDEAYAAILKQVVSEYEGSFTSNEKLFTLFYKKRDSLNDSFKSYFKNIIQKKELTFPVSYQKNITNAILINELGKDTLVSAKNEPVLLFGDSLNEDTRYHINKGEWSTMSSSKEENSNLSIKDEKLGFVITTKSYIDVKNWKLVVLSRMFWVLLASIGSIVTIVVLFVLAFYSFIKQKKNADIKTDFVNNITHELKTPLATLSIATKTLQDKNVQKNEAIVQSTIATIDRQRNRLQKVIDQVVHNSLGFEDIQLEKEEVYVKIWLENLINDYHLQHAGITLSSHLSKENIVLMIDKFQFNTVVLNVLDNAVKYGADTIAVSTEKSERYFSIIMVDNGVGIAKDQQKRVFDKFYRIDNNTVHNVKGLGLGLYYVNQIVKAHKGVVTLESQPSKGTTITIKIPMA